MFSQVRHVDTLGVISLNSVGLIPEKDFSTSLALAQFDPFTFFLLQWLKSKAYTHNSKSH